MLPEGIQQIEAREVLRVLPENVTGKKIALRMTGGVGDVVIALGGVAYALRKEDCQITAAVMPHHIPLMLEMVGIDKAIESKQLNRPDICQRYDSIVSFSGVFNNHRELRAGGYYNLVSERTGLKVRPGEFAFELPTFGRMCKRAGACGCESVRTVALHPGSSNPNRCWVPERWRELAYELRDRGCNVIWLGTRDEFGFSAEGISKFSDETEDLVLQSEALGECDYFIGNDSGFAHIAGVLNVPGLVLFFSTAAEDVINAYPKLKGVDVYERAGIKASRSLSPDCKAAQVAQQALSVADVMKASEFYKVPSKRGSRTEVKAVAIKLAIIGQPENPTLTLLRDFLTKHNYETKLLRNTPTHGTEFDCLISLTGSRCRLQVRGMSVAVDISNFENVRRAIRELLLKGDTDEQQT